MLTPCYLSSAEYGKEAQGAKTIAQMHILRHSSCGRRAPLCFDCRHVQGLRQQHAEILQNSHDAMRSHVWHNDQKSALLLAIVKEAGTS